MRRASKSAVLFSVAVVWAGCAPPPVAAPVGDGALVLEVGGDQPSLRASLQAAGRTVGPPRALVVEPSPARAVDATWPPAVGAPGGQALPDVRRAPSEPVVDPAADPLPPVPPAAEPRWLTAELADGETLIHLARRHLGDGRRYTDLLVWNGWTESQARRLPAGQKVKILLPDGR